MNTNFILIVLLIINILLLLYIIFSFKKKKINQFDFDSSLEKIWNNSSIEKKVGELTTYTNEIKNSYKSLEQLLKVPKERASFGEITLESILSDSLPQNMFGIREKVLDGKIPDAHIKSSVGIICIDSKFPLDNFVRFSESTDEKERELYKKEFLKNIQGHLKKIKDDYVCPEKGSSDFAFAYIPSESVYYFLLTEAFDLLRGFTKLGVQTISPLTLSHKIELIKANVHAHKLSEDAMKVKHELLVIKERFVEIDDLWKTFFEVHLKNATIKANEINTAYIKLRDKFDQVSK